MREAVASDDHKASTSDDTSFSALELLNDLARIAVNDKNKLDVSTIARGHASVTLVLSLVVIIDVSAVQESVMVSKCYKIDIEIRTL